MTANGSTPRTIIRRAAPIEAGALTRLAQLSKRHWGYPEAYLELWRDELTFSEEFVTRNEVYVAVSGERIVGVYGLIVRGETAELEHLWVLPAEIGRGIGRKLFAHARRTAAQRGCQRLEMVSDPFAEGFYIRMGAQRIAMVPARPAGRQIPRLRLNLTSWGERGRNDAHR